MISQVEKCEDTLQKGLEGGWLGPVSLYRTVPATVSFYPPGLFEGRFFSHLSGQFWIPIFLWRVHRDLPSVLSQTVDAPRGFLQSKRCVSGSFYYPSCGRNDDQQPQPSWWWARQRLGQYTHPSLVCTDHTDMPSSSLVDFSQKLVSISSLLLWVFFSRENACKSW